MVRIPSLIVFLFIKTDDESKWDIRQTAGLTWKYLHICWLQGLLGGNSRGGPVGWDLGGDNEGRSGASDSLAQLSYAG